jgi:hypothetical protein
MSEGRPRPLVVPLVVRLSFALVRAAAFLVPAAGRDDWRREWRAEIWHRWQFLFHTGAWNRAEKLRLLRSSAGALADASWLLASQEAVWNRVREFARSPFTCLAFLTTPLLLLALLSGGLPATRELLRGGALEHRNGPLLFIWLHPYVGGSDRGLPDDVVPAWALHSRLLRGVASFEISHRDIRSGDARHKRVLVITAPPVLFEVLGTQPAAGAIPKKAGLKQAGLVFSHAAWVKFAHADPAILGSRWIIAGQAYPVTAVLPASFQFVSRQPAIYLVDNLPLGARVFAVAHLKSAVAESQLNRELTKIAEDVCYYFLKGQLRFAFLDSMLLAPLGMFAIALAVASLLAAVVFRARLKYVRLAVLPQHRLAAVRRATFFIAKAALPLAAVLVGCLEWTRSEASLLLASQDPGSGPFLLWLYILGTMGVLFWAIIDQRARCRVCLRLLAFPVRIGCPGCLLLDWSGTELFCSEGHGVLHVPHLAPSWDEQAERWISLDESWQDLFADSKHA